MLLPHPNPPLLGEGVAHSVALRLIDVLYIITSTQTDS